MAANPLFGNKKRDSSIMYGLSRGQMNSSPATALSHSSSRSDGHRYPPPKRSRTSDSKKMNDPFSDHEDFTADDLEEIDILASQAYTQEPGPAHPPTNHHHSITVRKNDSPYTGKTTMAPPGQQRQRNSDRTDTPETFENKDAFGLEVLQAQHEELKKKLKELNDELLIKNGEIKVLRDSLRQTETNLELQKITNAVQEKEKSLLQNEKEKELAKKMQCLQSELQFKDAEMNELRTKLQNCERSNKLVVPPVSPRKSPSKSLKPDAYASPHSGRSNFPTRESFIEEMTPKLFTFTTPVIKAENESPNTTAKSMRTFSQSFYGQKNKGQGSVLLNALMQQPIRPGSLGMCHLLSSTQDILIGSPTRSTSNKTSTTASSVMSPLRSSALRDAQQLAITGLNSIAMSDNAPEIRDSRCRTGILHLNKLSRLPGAVHLLPLVEYHITAYCLALQTFEKSGGGPSETHSIISASTERSVVSSVEDPIVGLVNAALASLGIVYHLVFYSLDVVNTLLHSTTDRRTPAASTLEKDSKTVRPKVKTEGEQSQHPLFKKLVQTLVSSAVTFQRDLIRKQTLKVLVKLAENSPNDHLSSFHSLFSRPALLQCLAPDSPLSVAHLTVRLLALLIDCKKLADLLCSSSDSCLLLALYTYIISRPDKAASGTLWLHFEHEVVRFLGKSSIQGTVCPPTASGATCLCHREMVKALVLALHQEWLCVRRSARSPLSPADHETLRFLRDTILLLHSLSQKDKNFSEHYLEVLHQYDQALPGVRAVFKKFQVLKESEEFALDELCPPETEAEDEYMDCT
ncbi:ATR-interacting protein isoform 1-T2 [Discoglossus pictus]